MTNIDLCVEEISSSRSIKVKIEPKIEYGYRTDRETFWSFLIPYFYINGYSPIDIRKMPEELNFTIARAIDNALLKAIYPNSIVAA